MRGKTHKILNIDGKEQYLSSSHCVMNLTSMIRLNIYNSMCSSYDYLYFADEKIEIE